MSKRFGLIGAAGYIAPKHMAAIRDTGNILSVAMDPNDSVGILDSYFPDCLFFKEIETLDRHIYRLSKTGERIEYMSVCSPNYLHDSHIRLGLRNGCNVICEKPLVINPENIQYLKEVEKDTGRSVNTVLQLRYHKAIKELKEFYKDKSCSSKIKLNYITSRGNWYLRSWKGEVSKSGGLAANIGIHFFDMLTWIFGEPKSSIVTDRSEDTIAGILTLNKASVEWALSIDSSKLPEEVLRSGGRAFRSLEIDGREIDFSTGFTDLHTVTYQNILRGQGFGLDDALPSLMLCRDIISGQDEVEY
tara:strand:+ start:784 stop:1692 length:909 start_codon:yes stop_codon:yes gene_type:complete